MLPVYYQVRDWDSRGRPTERLLRRLSLESMIEDLRDLGNGGGVNRAELYESHGRSARDLVAKVFDYKEEIERDRATLDASIKHDERVERALGVRESTFHVDWARCQRCGLCADVCPVKAITWKKGGLAEIDQETCIYCGNCELACPPRFSAIARRKGEGPSDRSAGPVYRVIVEKCEKCGLCWKRCPVDAISWKKKELAVIDEDLCVRCGRCDVKCPDKWDAIEVIH
jgi:ferredoxin